MLCNDGKIELNTPPGRKTPSNLNRQSDFIPLRQRHDPREIIATFKEMYEADISPSLISKVTDAVKGKRTAVIPAPKNTTFLRP
ncbi:hypothetical protein YL93_17585 [Salmonella enterica subsp. enterica serovar Montevideo]|nr:hypothetical protein [Salmonella enterica subsp. enterica serovar Montevideo]